MDSQKEKNLMEFALQLYFQKHGKDKFLQILSLLEQDFKQAEALMLDFIIQEKQALGQYINNQTIAHENN